MTLADRSPPYAARLNAFKVGADKYWPGRNRITTIYLLERAASAGLTAMDLNYPDHFEGASPRDLADRLDGLGMVLNGAAMRWEGAPGGLAAHRSEWLVRSFRSTFSHPPSSGDRP